MSRHEEAYVTNIEKSRYVQHAHRLDGVVVLRVCNDSRPFVQLAMAMKIQSRQLNGRVDAVEVAPDA